MNWIKGKDAKRNIVISLTASAIFFIFIQPIMLLVWELTKKISSSTFEGIINGMYANAALGQRNWIDFLMFTAVLIIALNFALRTSINLKRTANRIIEDRNQELMSDEVIKDIEKIELKTKKLENILIKISNFRWLLNCAVFVATIHILFSSYTDLQLNTSFNQRIDAIAPYVTDDEIKLLKSQWALMKTRDDFIEISNIMENLANDSNIELPKNLLH